MYKLFNQEKLNQLACFIPIYKMKYSFLIKIGAEKYCLAVEVK